MLLQLKTLDRIIELIDELRPVVQNHCRFGGGVSIFCRHNVVLHAHGGERSGDLSSDEMSPASHQAYQKKSHLDLVKILYSLYRIISTKY